MKRFIISIHQGIKEKYNGFLLSIDYISKDKLSSGVICGIYKRPFYNINKHNINLGYLYISLKNFYKLFI